MQHKLKNYLETHNIKRSIIVCVSGGVDSMVFASLFNGLPNLDVYYVTVDHKLRAESTTEALWVGTHLNNHHILTWHHGGVTSRLQETARAARYDLIVNFAKHNNIQHAFLAHHADDQLETFFMRLFKGSGVKGLSSMTTPTLKDGIHFHRPLLQTSKSEIMAYANAHNVPFVNDPSNEKTCFKRVAIRQNILPMLDGDEKKNILKSIASLDETNAYIDKRMGDLYNVVTENDRISITKFINLESFEQQHVLRLYINNYSPKHYQAPMETVTFCIDQLLKQKAPAVSVHGLILKRSKGFIYTVVDARVR